MDVSSSKIRSKIYFKQVFNPIFVHYRNELWSS